MLYETGVQVANDGRAIYMRRTGCGPLVYLDGVKLTHLSRGGGPTAQPPVLVGRGLPWGDPDANPQEEAAWAVNLVHPGDVRVVEIYRGPAEVPGQYLDSNARCGVILIWTKRGLPAGGY